MVGEPRSWTRQWEAFESPTFVGETQVCGDLQEDLPVLRVWGHPGDCEVAHVTLTPDAARKLAAQLQHAADGAEWRRAKVEVERRTRYRTGWGPDSTNGVGCSACGGGGVARKPNGEITDCARCGGGGYVER